ncbi:hypothetical protein Trydic_g10812 [Trypoxylus dichotomus]
MWGIKLLASRTPKTLLIQRDQRRDAPTLKKQQTLEKIRYALAKPLALIINQSIKTTEYPLSSRRPRASPIFRNDYKSQLEKYKSIAIFSNFTKVFENILYWWIFHHTRVFSSSYENGLVQLQS